MTSSRRSSHSLHTPPSTWRRTLSVSKRSTPEPPTISLIFAQHEHDTTLGSAAAKLSPSNLPSIALSTSPLRDSSMPVGEDGDEGQGQGELKPKKRERAQSSLSSYRLRGGAGSDAATSGSTKRTKNLDDSASLKAQPPSSWFGSLSRKSSNQRMQIQDNMIIDAPVVSDSPESTSDAALPATEPTTTTTTTAPIPFPSSSPTKPPHAASTPSPGRPSWWSTKEPSRPSSIAEPPPPLVSDTSPAKNPDPEPSTAAIAVPESQPPRTPQSIPIPPGPSRPPSLWFSTASTSSPPARRPPHKHNLSIPCSVDEEVPDLEPLSPREPERPILISNAQSGTSKFTALNPSTSRFTLSIPLLGKPKIPLDQAVAQAAAASATSLQDSASAPPVLERSTPGNQEQLLAEKTDETTPTLTPTVRENVASPSWSYWDYVGWSGGTPQQKTSESVASDIADVHTEQPAIDPVMPDIESPAAPVVAEPTLEKSPNHETSPSTWSYWDYVGLGGNKPPSVNPAPHAEEPAEPPPASASAVEPIADPEPPRPSAAEQTDQTPSLLSDNTNATRGSFWFAPWALISEPGQPALAPARIPPPNTTDASTAADDNKPAPKTEAELVKEEALARLSEPESQSPTNPIESTISSNRSGWASFFSSKALTVKYVTEKGEDNGMENMDLDDEGERLVLPKNSRPESPAPGAKLTATIAKPAAPAGSEPPVKPKSSPAGKSGPPSRPDTPANPDTNAPKPKSDPPVPPLTNSESLKRQTVSGKRSSSPASKKSIPGSPRPPNLVLPTFADTFYAPPRSLRPPPRSSKLSKTLKLVGDVLFARDEPRASVKGKGKHVEYIGKELPRAWDVVNPGAPADVLRGCKRVCVIGIHGWFPGAIMRTVLGEPTGTSTKFANMMSQALEEFQQKHEVKFEKITKIPLEGEGTIDHRVDKLFRNLVKNEEWLDDLHKADVIFVATHSQGSVVSTHLLARLLKEGHIRTRRSQDAALANTATVASGVASASAPLPPQRVCCLALCGIHLGPLTYLNMGSLVQPYLQYFESAAATELFEFQDTESEVSKNYVKTLQLILEHGMKLVYVASLNDQVVPIYSGAFTSVTHPLILRALYIDGDAYHSSDFLSNLLVLLLRIRNAGFSDGGLLAHLSEATAGSLSGVGHSSAYEELATFSLAVDYLFLVNNGLDDHVDLNDEPFNARSARNDYEIPWALRDLIADDRVSQLFAREFAELRDTFDDWQPRTSILRDIKRKLQPIQRLSSIANSSNNSKL